MGVCVCVCVGGWVGRDGGGSYDHQSEGTCLFYSGGPLRWARHWALLATLRDADDCFIQHYSSLLSRLIALLSHAVLNEWLAFHSIFSVSTVAVYVQGCFGCHVADATWSCCHLGAFCVHHKPFMSCHFMQSHVLSSVHACVAVRVQGLLISAPGHVTTTLPPSSAKPSGFLGPSNPQQHNYPHHQELVDSMLRVLLKTYQVKLKFFTITAAVLKLLLLPPTPPPPGKREKKSAAESDRMERLIIYIYI